MNATYLIIVVTILVVLWGLWLAKQFWFRPTEWANFIIAAWSAAFATLIFGFIVGYSIYYIQHSQETSEHRQEKTQEALSNRAGPGNLHRTIGGVSA
jgi:hypothetical protein